VAIFHENETNKILTKKRKDTWLISSIGQFSQNQTTGVARKHHVPTGHMPPRGGEHYEPPPEDSWEH